MVEELVEMVVVVVQGKHDTVLGCCWFAVGVKKKNEIIKEREKERGCLYKRRVRIITRLPCVQKKRDLSLI